MAIEILLYSCDEYLSEELRDFLSREQRLFSVFHFNTVEDGAAYFATHLGEIKCVLASPIFFDALSTVPPVAIELGETSVLEPQNAERFSVNVFQKRSSLLEDLMSIFRAKNLMAQRQQTAGETLVLSFFSTQGGCGCTTLSYLCAVRAAQSSSTAYICLDAGPCTETLYRILPQTGAEEFLFLLQERADAKTILATLSRNEHGVYVLPTFSSLLDQAMLMKNDVEYLIQVLSQSGMFHYLIFDLNDMLGTIERYVLSCSDRVAMVYTDNKMGAAKRRQLEKDPNYTTYPFVEKEYWVTNICKSPHGDSNSDVSFPLQNGIDSLTDISTILVGNTAFSDGCDVIISTIS